jgi:hypothetical protein
MSGQAAPDAGTGTPMYVLESATPLSQSMVWRLQRTFYGDQGIAAWSQSRVPHAVTTSPNIARAYARVVLGFLRDAQTLLDPSQPVYIVELGAGSGRFAYRFLKAFTGLLDDAARTFHVVYVMTDASTSVLDFWRDNSRLRPFIDDGLLDFARFDLMELSPLELLNTRSTLRVGEVANPVVLIGNYIFDSIPQDSFTVKGGQLFANLVTVSASAPELNLTAPDSRVRISITFDTDTVPTDGPTEDPLVQEILHNYRQRLDSTTLMVPSAALACVRYFHDLGGGRGLCLIGDFGDTHEDELRSHGPPGFGAGGGFWLPVNFHMLGEYARSLGGHARHPRSRHLSLNISMLLFGSRSIGSTEAELAYSDVIDHQGPDELSVMIRAVAEQMPTLKFEVVLALLRATGWDSEYLGRCVPFLIETLPTAEDRLRADLLQGIYLAWEQYYPIGEADDVPFGLGALLYTLGQFPEALAFFERSLEQFGEDPRTTLNIALTLYRMQRLSESLVWFDRTLALDASNERAIEMRPSVAAELAASA